MSQWTDEDRKGKLTALVEMAAPLRAAAQAEAELLAGEKPLQPVVGRELEAASGDVLELCTSITITWEEAKGSEDVFFYVLETQGVCFGKPSSRAPPFQQSHPCGRTPSRAAFRC